MENYALCSSTSLYIRLNHVILSGWMSLEHVLELNVTQLHSRKTYVPALFAHAHSTSRQLSVHFQRRRVLVNVEMSSSLVPALCSLLSLLWTGGMCTIILHPRRPTVELPLASPRMRMTCILADLGVSVRVHV